MEDISQLGSLLPDRKTDLPGGFLFVSKMSERRAPTRSILKRTSVSFWLLCCSFLI